MRAAKSNRLGLTIWEFCLEIVVKIKLVHVKCGIRLKRDKGEKSKVDKEAFAGKLKSSNGKQAEIVQACVGEGNIFYS